MFALCMVLVVAVYMYVRSVVQGNLAGFVPFPVFRFARMSALDRIGMMMTEIPRIAQLLVFPTKLSGDYSPTEVTIPDGLQAIELPGFFICVGVVALALALRRRAPVASFGLAWLVLSYLPVSNLLIPAGFITAERTLFFPSVGVVLVAGAAFEWLRARERPAERRAALAAVGLLLILGTARSIDRQRVWKNNDVFFEQLVLDQPNGYRAHFLRGRQIGGHGRLVETEAEYRRVSPTSLGLNRGQQVALLERLDQVSHRAGVARLLDEVALTERSEHDDRGDALSSNLRRRRDAVHLGHLDVADDHVGQQLVGQRDGVLAVGRLAHDIEAFLDQHLPQVEPDEGLVLGDHDSHGARH